MGAHGRYVFGSNVLGTGQIGGGGQSTRLGCAARGLTHTVSPTGDEVLQSARHEREHPELPNAGTNPRVADSATRAKDAAIVSRQTRGLEGVGL
jgi:hypothetical protein